ncbi:XRE family transcriptional regulator [Micromonospora sp. NPDC049559]|uniref:helix-turn-helix domain-containing protein n=1 Tax=Micromonospora sp. NPDC049559 TaxID=3155923 RepID=UPI0034306084
MLTDTGSTRVEAVTAAVAQHVRELRTGRGWSLDELAGRSGVSKGMVVQIEGARTNPSVGTLCRLADAFGVTVARLLEPAADRAVRITRAEEAPLLWRGERGGVGRLLGGLNDPNFVELWEWRLKPGERHGSADHAPGTRELLHILTGTAIVTVDGVDHAVTTGETIEFRADRGHTYRNDGDEDVRLTMVVVMPSGEWDRRVAARPERPA